MWTKGNKQAEVSGIYLKIYFFNQSIIFSYACRIVSQFVKTEFKGKSILQELKHDIFKVWITQMIRLTVLHEYSGTYCEHIYYFNAINNYLFLCFWNL